MFVVECVRTRSTNFAESELELLKLWPSQLLGRGTPWTSPTNILCPGAGANHVSHGRMIWLQLTFSCAAIVVLLILFYT